MSEDKSFLKRLLTETWPAKMAQDALKAVMLPGDVYQGKVSMYGEDGRTNPEVINRSADLAGLVTLGAGAVPAEANSLRSGIKAYHGSPHDFDRFDLSKIGTGEGAQAYGHGLYFAENEGVAKGYRDALSTPTVKLDPQKVKDEIADAAGFSPEAVRMARQELQNLNGDVGQTLSLLDGLHLNTGYGRAKEAATVIRAMSPSHIKENGSMYEVNINADPARFLDWDKPLSQQPQAARDVVNKKFSPPGTNRYLDDLLLVSSTKENGLEYTASGSRIYQALANGNRQEISRQLNEAGIPGIKYLDQGSRGAGDGSRNYVVFDDKLIDILRKYGLAGASASPLAALMASQGQGELQQ